VATVPFSLFVELTALAALGLAVWFSGVGLLTAAVVTATAFAFFVAAIWPLSAVPPRSDKVNFSGPSQFYSGNP
jgi:hypothetical protein